MSIVAIALSVLGHVGPASAAECRVAQPSLDRTGQARTVNAPDHLVLLEDGTKLWLAEDLTVTPLREGVTVKLSYEQRNGQHVATPIETAE